MNYCCRKFETKVGAGEIVAVETCDTTTWQIPELWALNFCPFCGEDVRQFKGDTSLAGVHEMGTLESLYKRIEGAAYFRGIEITNPDTMGLFSTRPLHIATTWGDCEAIKLLVEAGADINAQGEYGFTPLMEAVSLGNREVITLLIELGAEPIENEDGELPSQHAALLNFAEIAADLKEKGF